MTREYTQAAQALIETQARFARGSIERASVEFGSEWDNAFEQLLARVYRDPLAMADAVKGYAAFAVDSMRRQRRFEVEREYPAKTFAEAAQEVYLNDEYMHTQYLPGLLLSHYLWPHHYLQLQYFERFFLPSLAKEARPRFAEVGIGTGVLPHCFAGSVEGGRRWLRPESGLGQFHPRSPRGFRAVGSL